MNHVVLMVVKHRITFYNKTILHQMKIMAIYAPDCGAVLPNPASHAFHSAITAMDVTLNSVDFFPWPGRHVRRTSSTFAHGGLYYHGDYTDHAAYREIE